MYFLAMSSTCLRISALNCFCASARSTWSASRSNMPVVVLQGKLRVHPSPIRWAGGRRRAVDAHAVGERVLQLERRGRQNVPHQGFKLDLAKGTAERLSRAAPEAHDAARQVSISLRPRRSSPGACMTLRRSRCFLNPREALVDLARIWSMRWSILAESLARIGEMASEPVACCGEPDVQIGEHRTGFSSERATAATGLLASSASGQSLREPDENGQARGGDDERNFSHGPL